MSRSKIQMLQNIRQYNKQASCQKLFVILLLEYTSIKFKHVKIGLFFKYKTPVVVQQPVFTGLHHVHERNYIQNASHDSLVWQHRASILNNKAFIWIRCVWQSLVAQRFVFQAQGINRKVAFPSKISTMHLLHGIWPVVMHKPKKKWVFMSHGHAQFE